MGAGDPVGSPHREWWAVVVLFGAFGGIAAYFVHHRTDPASAKKLLIAGIVAIFIWYSMML